MVGIGYHFNYYQAPYNCIMNYNPEILSLALKGNEIKGYGDSQIFQLIQALLNLNVSGLNVSYTKLFLAPENEIYINISKLESNFS